MPSGIYECSRVFPINRSYPGSNYYCDLYIIQVNEKSFDKREYRDGIKRQETRQGWMDGYCHGDNLRILLTNRHKPYLMS